MNFGGANGSQAEVLLVDDSPGDVRLTREALREAGSSIHLHVATDGEAALHFLRKQERYIHAPRPHLILLDLNLPKMGGIEVLAQIKADEALKTIPTIILTTSEADGDIAKSYELNANCFLSKPVQLYAFDRIVKSINDFWLRKAILPPESLAVEQEIGHAMAIDRSRPSGDL